MTKLEPELLRILCCPESRQSLREAGEAEVASINARIAAGTVRNRGGDVVREPVDGALVRADGRYLFPVRHGIPVLLIEEMIATS